MRGRLAWALAGAVLVGPVWAQDSFEVWKMTDAEEVLECAAVLSLFEEAPGGEPWPEYEAVDFPAASAGLVDLVALAHGRSFAERGLARFQADWSTHEPTPERAQRLAELLPRCRVYGRANDLPM